MVDFLRFVLIFRIIFLIFVFKIKIKCYRFFFGYCFFGIIKYNMGCSYSKWFSLNMCGGGLEWCLYKK